MINEHEPRYCQRSVHTALIYLPPPNAANSGSGSQPSAPLAATALLRRKFCLIEIRLSLPPAIALPSPAARFTLFGSSSTPSS